MIIKKPTIKGTSRAYVRLFQYLGTVEEWLSFLEKYAVEDIPFGQQRFAEHAIRVLDRSNGELATLGLDLPCVIKYRNNIEPSRQFWIEEFQSATHRRRRILEVGRVAPSTDEIQERN